jgi:hypothetical protein
VDTILPQTSLKKPTRGLYWPRIKEKSLCRPNTQGIGVHRKVLGLCSPSGGNLSKPGDEVRGPQMNVALQHFHFAVARDGADLGDVETLFEKPTDRFMTQIMEMKIGHLGSHTQMLKSQPNGIAGHRKHSLAFAIVGAQLAEGLDRSA